MATNMSLCWDCCNATGNCLWSRYGKPVPGWEADYLKPNGTKPYDTYLVRDCPEFVRDSYDGGIRREQREIKLTKR